MIERTKRGRRAIAGAWLITVLVGAAPQAAAQDDGDDAPIQERGEEPDADEVTQEDAGADAADGEPTEATDDASRARANALADLATMLELGLVTEVLERGLPLVARAEGDAPAGELADDGRAVALVARALFQAGREDEATTLLTGAVVDPATGTWVELEWARIELLRDELDAALGRLVYEDGTLRLPQVPHAWMLTGRTLFRRGNLTASARFLRGFLERAPFHPDSVSALHMLSVEAVQRRDVEAAETLRAESERRRRAFEVVRARSLQVRANPDDALPRYGLGLAYLELGDAASAADALAELLARFPEFQRGYFQYGEALRLLGDRDGALAAYGAGLERDADDHKCRLNRGLVLVELGRFDDALADFDALLASEVADDPQFAGLYLGLTRVYDLTGEIDAGTQAYAKYRELGGTESR